MIIPNIWENKKWQPNHQPDNHSWKYMGFLYWGIPRMDGLSREIPIKIDDLGVPPILGNHHIMVLEYNTKSND